MFGIAIDIDIRVFIMPKVMVNRAMLIYTDMRILGKKIRLLTHLLP